MKNMRRTKELLQVLQNTCNELAREIKIVGINYSRPLSMLEVHVDDESFETGGFPIERVSRGRGLEYAWRVECNHAGLRVFALCNDDEIARLPIPGDAVVSEEAARYLRFLVTEKAENTRKEREASGVAGN